MNEPTFQPLPPTRERPRGERSAAAIDVEALLDSPGWVEIEAAIEDRLRFEQKLAMAVEAGKVNEAQHERRLGSWSGLRKVRAIAEGIVADGKQAEAEIREAA